MSLRPAAAGDADPVVRLETSLFGADAWSRGVVTDELTGPDRYAVVVDVAGAVVGYAVASAGGDVADLHRIGVHPAHRRRGWARRLIDAVTTAMGERGCSRVVLEVGADNRAALELYARAGFVAIDRRHGYYRGGYDALVLQRRLHGSAAPLG